MMKTLTKALLVLTCAGVLSANAEESTVSFSCRKYSRQDSVYSIRLNGLSIYYGQQGTNQYFTSMGFSLSVINNGIYLGKIAELQTLRLLGTVAEMPECIPDMGMTDEAKLTPNPEITVTRTKRALSKCEQGYGNTGETLWRRQVDESYTLSDTRSSLSFNWDQGDRLEFGDADSCERAR